jgi:acyl carrier protein
MAAKVTLSRIVYKKWLSGYALRSVAYAMILPSEAAEKLAGYPAQILESYAAFYQGRQPADLNKIIFGFMAFLLPEPPTIPIANLRDTTNLRKDLGMDSITIAEVVFIAEDLFDLTIKNETLIKLESIGALKDHLHKHLID